ncbi:BamA/TamA family outer membrane protein [Candidatus Dependentiae bacterium]|nr:BamA/TamA family outer membrane protein [Candidatus Dependentiae bacterium]
MFLSSLFFIFIFFIGSSQTQNINVNLKNEFSESIFNDIQFPLYLNDIKIFSDVIFDDFEQCKLIDLKPGLANEADLKNLLQNLKKKNKFESCTLSLKKLTGNKFNLLLKLHSYRTFENVRIKGRLRNKEKYLRNYHFEVGEFFDENKHKHFISKIIKDLHADGFLSANVTDKIDYNPKTKSVIVKLHLENLDRYVIEDIDLQFKSKKINNDHLKLKQKIQVNFLNSLKKNIYSKNLINEHIENLKKYLAKKGYLFSKIKFNKNFSSKKNKIILNFEIDLQNKRKFIFFGNHFFTTNQLLSRMLYFGDSLLLISPSLLAQEIADIYHNFGFWDIVVNVKEEDGKIYFLINEGQRAEIKKISIQGNKQFQNNFFDSVLENKFYDKDTLKQALDEMTLFYLQQGFWDFEIINQNLKQLGLNQEYELEISIHEGERKFLKKIEVENFPNPFILSGGPVPFNVDFLKEQKESLINHFRSCGYLYVEIDYKINEEPDGCILVWQIKGDINQVTFGKTIICGSSSLPSDIILRELTFKKDEIFDRKRIDESLKKLRNLNIFDQINLTVLNNKNKKNEKDLLLKYNLDDPFEIRTRVGFQSVSRNLSFNGGLTYLIGASFIWKNPFNYADIIKIILEANRYKSDICFSYEVPWFFQVPIRTAFKVYSIRYEQPIVIGSRKNLYKAFQDGCLVNCTKKLERYDFSMNLGFEAMKIDSLQPHLAALIDFQARLLGKYVPYFFIEPSIFLDFIDDKLNPKKGSLTLFSAKGMFPINLPQGYFIKFLFEQSFFFPIVDPIICALRFRFGHIFNSDFKNIMPIERFYLGGSFSIRSYEPDHVPPVNFLPKDDTNSCCLVPTGGKSMVNINSEFRFPLYQKISGVIFNDMGVLVGQKFSDILGNNWVGGTGFGLRYATPVGPIRFDIGWKWKKRFPQDKSYSWTLTLGQAF